jgi:hypothetical protein
MNIEACKPPSTIRDGKVFCSLSDDDGYSVTKLFKPVTVKVPERCKPATFLVKAFRKITEREFEPTPQELDWHSRQKYQWPVRKQKPHIATSFSVRSGKLSDFVHDGVFWRRTKEGEHAHCWTDSRINAVYMWLDHEHAHPCQCSQRNEFTTKLAAGTETVKPVLESSINGMGVMLSLDRSIEGPRGVNWSYHTGQTFIRISLGSSPDVAIPYTYAKLERLLRHIEENGNIDLIKE